MPENENNVILKVQHQSNTILELITLFDWVKIGAILFFGLFIFLFALLENPGMALFPLSIVIVGLFGVHMKLWQSGKNNLYYITPILWVDNKKTLEAIFDFGLSIGIENFRINIFSASETEENEVLKKIRRYAGSSDSAVTKVITNILGSKNTASGKLTKSLIEIFADYIILRFDGKLEFYDNLNTRVILKYGAGELCLQNWSKKDIARLEEILLSLKQAIK